LRRSLDWEKAAVDEEGRMRAIVSGDTQIWVPPSVEIASIPNDLGDQVLSITYPIPENWKPPVERSDVSVTELEEVGWKKKRNIKGVLQDFIEIADGSPENVKNFVLMWGPLWQCYLHEDCVWTDSLWKFEVESQCQWFPAEAINIFHKMAKRAKAAFKIAYHLMNDEIAPQKFWEDFITPKWKDKESIKEQRIYFTRAVNLHLFFLNTPCLRLQWKDGPRGYIAINTDLGFIRLVWLQIVQLISGTQMLHICDGCGKPYMRQLRKAAEGRRNYCKECGSRASKRDWARDKRRERE
jgi:hypothetical protein